MAVGRHPYLIAILLHVAVFVTIGFYTIDATGKKSSDRGSASSVSSADSSGGFAADNVPFTSTQLQTRLSNSVRTADRLSPDEKFDKAGDYASRLESMSSVASMKEMGAYLRSTVTWKPKEGVFEAGKEKEFDHSSSMPIGAREVADGKYVFIFRDANDNRCELPVAPGDETAAKAFALLDRSDVLREFKTSILLPMLNQRLDQN
jgi:hypothetical protein